MAKLEELERGGAVLGILADCLLTVVDAKWRASAAIELTQKGVAGMVHRDHEPSFEVVETGRPWSFDGDGKHFRVVSEAQRIHLSYVFEPLQAICRPIVDQLPHQIIAVYAHMLPRQVLRFLLADDPLRGKTIMLGLLIKQLLIRGDLHRCLIACPENLVERWQKQLYHRFQPIPKEQWIAQEVPSWPNESARRCRRGSWLRNSRGQFTRIVI